MQSTLFARFSFKRRLTIHKWLWPLTPLVHLRPPSHLRAAPASVSVSLGSEWERVLVDFRPGLHGYVPAAGSSADGDGDNNVYVCKTSFIFRAMSGNRIRTRQIHKIPNKSNATNVPPSATPPRRTSSWGTQTFCVLDKFVAAAWSRFNCTTKTELELQS